MFKLEEERLHGHYVENDGEFVLQLENFADRPEVAGLVSAIKRIAEENAERRKRLAELHARVPQDFSIDELELLRSLARD